MSLVAVVAVNDLNSFVYQAAPYNFTAAINGLINIPSLSKFIIPTLINSSSNIRSWQPLWLLHQRLPPRPILRVARPPQ